MRLAVIFLLATCLMVAEGQDQNVRVECDSTTMTVYLNMNLLDRISDAQYVHFRDETCTGQADTTGNYVVLTTRYDACDTVFMQNATYFSYSNLVTFYAPMISGGVVITREEILRIPVRCELDRRYEVENYFVPVIHKHEFEEVGYGNFSLRLDRYQDSAYAGLVVDREAEVDLAERLYFAVNLQSVPGLTLLTESCWAVPYPNPNQKTYSLFQDRTQGCTKDRTVQFHTSGDPMMKRFSFQAFTFIEENPLVFVHCSVLVCNATDTSSRCAQGRCEDLSRGRRSIDTLFPGPSSTRHIISSGPLIARKSRASDSDERLERESSENLLPTALIGAVVCMLCLVVAMVSVLLYTRASRRTRSQDDQGLKSVE